MKTTCDTFAVDIVSMPSASWREAPEMGNCGQAVILMKKNHKLWREER